MRLSIIIPTFNRAVLLARTLQSIDRSARQSGDAPEIIVVDDGSTDDTANIAVPGRTCTRLLRQSNAGPGAARNLGASAATGDYLAFVDADDLWLPWTLDVATRLLGEGASLLASMPRTFESDDQVETWAQGPVEARTYPDYLSSDPSTIFPGAGSLFVRREAFLAAGGFPHKRMGAEDADLFLRLGCAPGFVFVRSPALVAYRLHPGSFSLDVNAGLEGRWAMLEAEARGQYPGGSAREADRRRIITSHCRSATVVAARGGRFSQAARLYLATGGWHMRERRWKYLAGFPLYAMSRLFAGRDRQGFLPAAPTIHAVGDPAGLADRRPAVVFATRNRREELRRAIQSCARQSVPVRVIVRDDASDDGTEAMVREEFPWVEYARHPQPRGSIVNRNEAVAAAEGAAIVFSLDDDAAFASDRTVEQTLADFDEARVGIVAIPFVDVLKGEVVEQASPGPGTFVLDTFRGCAAAWRRSAFQAVGGYSACLRHMAEEPDLSLRMLDAGLIVRAGRADPVHHFESPHRDRAHIWKQIARNGVLQGWMTAPWWMLPVHLMGTVLAAVRVGMRERRLAVMVGGVWQGLAECVAGKVPRRAVSARTYFLCRWLRKHKPAPIEDVAGRLGR